LEIQGLFGSVDTDSEPEFFFVSCMNTVKLSVRLPERLRKRVKGQNLPRRRKVSRSLLSSEPTISPEKESGHDSRDEESGLVWRPVARSQLRSGFDDAAVLTFEEIDDVDIVYEELEGGRKRAKLAVCTRRDSVILGVLNCIM
jgi:hypothetical protein